MGTHSIPLLWVSVGVTAGLTHTALGVLRQLLPLRTPRVNHIRSRKMMLDDAGISTERQLYCPVTMGSSADHREWSEQNADLARQLAAAGDDASQRWTPVAAYYAVMHALQAVAAAHGDQRIKHEEVIEIPADYDLPNHRSLEVRARELYRHCNAGRYLRGSGAVAAEWFKPFTQRAEDLVNESIRLMESVLNDL